MDTDSSMQLITLLLLIVLSACFSSSETAMLSVNRIRLRNMEEEGNQKAGLVLQLLDQQNKMISALLVGNNIVNIGASALATKIAIDLWGSPGVGFATGIMTLLILVFGEVIPKNLAASHATKWSIAVAPLLRLLCIVLTPVVKLLTMVSDWVVKLSKGDEGDPLITEDELKLLVNAGQEEGFLAENETEMINSIFEFDDTIVNEIMVPRIDIMAIGGEQTLDSAIDLIVNAGHSRIPVYENSIDNIVGILYAKDLFKKIGQDFQKMKVKELIRSAYYIPENKKVSDLLTELRAKKVHMAIILDEYGGTAGLITIEDLIEEIIGDIQDEYDVEEEMIVTQSQGHIIADARALIEEVTEALDIELSNWEDTESDTIGGLVFEHLGEIPEEGDQVKIDQMDIRVIKVNGRRVSKVEIFRTTSEEETEEQDTEDTNEHEGSKERK